MLLGRTAGGRESHHGAEHVGRIARVEHERLGQDGDVVSEDRGDLVRVARAPDVPEQRHPVSGPSHLFAEPRFCAQHVCEETRPQLRLERLAERVVLPERERGDELAEAEGRTGDREPSRFVVGW